MAFTPYAAVAALLVAGVALALRNWAAAGVAALATLCLAAAVLPRAIGDGTVDAEGRETFTVLSTNIHHGTADPAAVVALVERYDPDLLSVQELTPSFARELSDAGLASAPAALGAAKPTAAPPAPASTRASQCASCPARRASSSACRAPSSPCPAGAASASSASTPTRRS